MQESSATSDREEAERFLRLRLDARDEGILPSILASRNLTFGQWAEWFLENRSRPPFRAAKTHAQHRNAIHMLKPVFQNTRLADITTETIEEYLLRRLSAGKRCRTKLGIQFRGTLKPATVHQELRVLRRILNIAVKQKRLSSNPCNSVEFPVQLSRTTQKSHYVTASEQERIELCAPQHLRNIITIITETGLRPYKELMPMKKSQIDLANSVLHVPDSKTPSGIGDVPLTDLARAAIKSQMADTAGSAYLFPSSNKKTTRPYLTTLKTAWRATLRRAKIAYFPLYHLRHTFASRLSAGGVSDHIVTLMLRQGNSEVFKRYSQAKLNMMRESLAKLDRHANEHGPGFVTARPN